MTPESGRAPLGFALAAALAAASMAAIAIPMFTGAGGGPAAPRDAAAAIIPAGCDPTAGSAAATIRIDPAPVTVTDGTLLHYKVGAAYPAPVAGVGCDAFDIDVFIDVPGATGWEWVCNISNMSPGPTTTECAGSVDYTASGGDRVGDLLIANVKIIGNKHDRAEGDCIAQSRTPTVQTTCFDAAAVSVIGMPNTPTPTSTPTNTPTNTPTTVPSNTPTRTNTPRSTNTPRRNTSTPVPNTPTPVNTVLPTRVVPTATQPAGIIILPQTGTGGPDGGGFPIVAASIAGAGLLAFGAGAGLRKRDR